MRTALVTLAGFVALGYSARAGEPEILVARLASRSFAEREAATKGLDGLGTAALPALHKAIATDSDPEVQCRASGLIAGIQRRADSILFTRAAPVAFDFNDRPLHAAVTELRAKTGIPLVLDASVKDRLRPVTIKTADLPPWQAIEKFCTAAGLKEDLKPDAKPEVKVRLGRRPLQPEIPVPTAAVILDNPGAVPIVLVDGTGASAMYAEASVRIRALPMSYPGSGLDRAAGELKLHFDVAPLPGLNWVCTREIRILKATTATGRELTALYRPDAVLFTQDTPEVGMAIDDPGELPPLKPTRTNARALPLTFKLDDRDIKTLRTLEGVILGEVTRPNRPIITVDHIAASLGGTFDHRDRTLTVVSMASDAKSGSTTLILRIAKFWSGEANGELPFDPRDFANLRYYDRAGKLLKQPFARVVQLPGPGGDDEAFTCEAHVRFGSGLDNIAPKPVKIVMFGTETVTVEVPFKLKDIPLE